MRITFFLLLLFLLNACGGKSDTVSNSTLASQCSANKLTKSSTFEYKFEMPVMKVVRADFVYNKNISKLSKVQNNDSFDLRANQKITVSVDRNCLKQRGSSLGFTLTENIKARDALNKYSRIDSYSVKLPKSMSFEELERLAEKDSCIKMISPEVAVSLAAITNDDYFPQQDHLIAIKYESVFDYFFTSSNSVNSDTVVAVIDDGIELTHADLKDQLWINTAEKNGASGVDDDGNGYKDDIYGYDFASRNGNPSHKTANDSIINSHGSHVAGLIAATTNNSTGISGLMAKNVKIMALNIFGDNGTASSTDIVNAIHYAADMGAKVINLSISGKGQSSSIKQALQYAVSKGATVLTAAGNDSDQIGQGTNNFYIPASYGADINGVITIGATDANSSRVGALCDFSNYSSTYVELGAPGCDSSHGTNGLLSTVRESKYGWMMGTSMASPVAAGAAAVVYSFVRDAHDTILSPAQVEDLLKAGSRNIPSLNSVIRNGKNIDLTIIKGEIESRYGTPTEPEDPVDPVDPGDPTLPGCP